MLHHIASGPINEVLILIQLAGSSGEARPFVHVQPSVCSVCCVQCVFSVLCSMCNHSLVFLAPAAGRRSRGGLSDTVASRSTPGTPVQASSSPSGPWPSASTSSTWTASRARSDTLTPSSGCHAHQVYTMQYDTIILYCQSKPEICLASQQLCLQTSQTRQDIMTGPKNKKHTFNITLQQWNTPFQVHKRAFDQGLKS